MKVASRIIERARLTLRGPGAWRAWAGLLIVVALVAYSLYSLFGPNSPQIDFGELVSRVQPGDLVLAALVYSLALIVAIAGWGLLLGTLSGFWSPVEHVRIYLLTGLTRRLPGTFWYIVGRVVLYERLGVPRGITALAGGLEYAINGVSCLLLAIAAWPLVFSGRGLSPLWQLLALAIGAALLNPPVVRAIVRRLSRRGGSVDVRYRHLLAWVLIFALVWALGGCLLFVVTRAVAPLPWSLLPAMIGVWAVAGVASTLIFSFLPFGLGATELTLAALLSSYINPAEALFVALLMRLLLTCFELGYGVAAALLSLPVLRRALHNSAESHPDAEKPEGVFEHHAVLPPKEVS